MATEDAVKIMNEVLESIDQNPTGTPIKVEAAPMWCGKENGGEVQAVVQIYGVKYCLSLEPLP